MFRSFLRSAQVASNHNRPVAYVLNSELAAICGQKIVRPKELPTVLSKAAIEEEAAPSPTGLYLERTTPLSFKPKSKLKASLGEAKTFNELFHAFSREARSNRVVPYLVADKTLQKVIDQEKVTGTCAVCIIKGKAANEGSFNEGKYVVDGKSFLLDLMDGQEGTYSTKQVRDAITKHSTEEFEPLNDLTFVNFREMALLKPVLARAWESMGFKKTLVDLQTVVHRVSEYLIKHSKEDKVNKEVKDLFCFEGGKKNLQRIENVIRANSQIYTIFNDKTHRSFVGPSDKLEKNLKKYFPDEEAKMPLDVLRLVLGSSNQIEEPSKIVDVKKNSALGELTDKKKISVREVEDIVYKNFVAVALKKEAKE